VSARVRHSTDISVSRSKFAVYRITKWGMASS
jgi:hypothetical protein